MSRDPFHQSRVLRAPSNLVLNTSREGAATASLGSLGQCFTTTMVKNFFLISNLNLPSFSLEPFPLVPSLHTLVKSPSPSFLSAPSGTGRLLSRSVSALVSIVGKSYSIPIWIPCCSFFCCFLTQSLQSAARQPWGFLRSTQAKAGSANALYLELRDPSAPSGAGPGWRDRQVTVCCPLQRCYGAGRYLTGP